MSLQNKVHKKEFQVLVDMIKTAGGPGSGVEYPNTMPIKFLKTSPLISIGKRKEFMGSHTPVSKNIVISYKDIKYKGQENMVPKKVINILLHADEALQKPVDVILDNEGAYHIMDGHHRAIVAILLKRTLRANVYRVYKGFKE